MQTLFLELTLLVSLAVVVYLMAAAVPRVEDKKHEDSNGIEGNLISGVHFDRLDKFLLKAKDKLLRRLKVMVMKTDNLISKQLKNKGE